MKDKEPQTVNIVHADDTPGKKTQRSVWARLIQKVFEVNPLECPICGSQMVIKSFIFHIEELERIIVWMALKGKPPSVKQLMKAGGDCFILN